MAPPTQIALLLSKGALLHPIHCKLKDMQLFNIEYIQQHSVT